MLGPQIITGTWDLIFITFTISFEKKATVCKQCPRYLCEVCGNEKPSVDYSTSIRKNWNEPNRQHRCQSCHSCDDCGEERPTDAFRRETKVCNECDLVHCGACQQSVRISIFNKKQMNNYRTLGRNLICPSCVAKGCTSRTIRLNPCSSCKELKGIEKFNKTQWHNYEKDQKTLICTDCAERNLSKLKHLRPLVQKSKLKCKCNNRIDHGERCPLFGTSVGDRRWPGKDTGVSDTDQKFLHDQKPDWWCRALRRNQ